MATRRRAALPFVAGLALVCAAGAARACLWEYGEDVEGRRREVAGDCESYARAFAQESGTDWEAKRAEHERRLASDPDFRLRSDHATALVHLGKAAEAARIFEELAREHPSEYVVAANLGTAYELLGEDEKALAEIRRALDLNPDSHFGTEWVHVRILELKIARSAESTPPAVRSALALDFGEEDAPRRPATTPTDARGRPLELAAIREALEYQLRERIPLVEPPDPVVAALLYDLANLAALTLPAACAAPLLQKALTYGHPDVGLIERRIASVRATARRSKWERATRPLRTPWAALVAALAVVVAVLVHRRWAR